MLFAPVQAPAQTTGSEDTASLRAQKDTLFQQMLRDPANLDVTFKYADVAARLGDYEAAVAALERMLLFNPTCRGFSSSSGFCISVWAPTALLATISTEPRPPIRRPMFAAGLINTWWGSSRANLVIG